MIGPGTKSDSGLVTERLTGPVIDAEVHLFPPEWCVPGYRPAPVERVMLAKLYDHPDGELALSRAHAEPLLEEMGRSGIEGAVLLGLPWRSPQMNERNNEYIAGVVHDHPGTFLGFGVTSPPMDVDIEREVALIEEVHGLRGVKVIPGWQGWRLDDAVFEPALAEMERRGLFLFPHIDHGYLPAERSDAAAALLEVAARHPDLKILVPHLGGLVCLYNQHEPVARLMKNMLFIGSVPLTMRMILWAVDALGADRVAFGTDYPFNPSHDQRSQWEAFEALPLDREDRRRIAGQNLIEFTGWRR